MSDPTGTAISVSEAYPVMTSAIVIDGKGNTFDGGGATYFFETATGAEVSLRNMTLTNGYHTFDGGAIYHQFGTMFLTNVTITNSASLRGAGAIRSLSTLHISDSYFADNSGVREGGSDTSGAINHTTGGDLRIDKSVFTGNSGDEVIRVYFNSSLSSGEIVIRNSTIYGNSTLGIRIARNAGSLTSRLNHLTVKDGVEFGQGEHYVHNNIFYGATTDCALVDGGTLTTYKNNIVGVNSCGDGVDNQINVDPELPANPTRPTGQTAGYLTHFPLTLPTARRWTRPAGLTASDLFVNARPDQYAPSAAGRKWRERHRRY